MSQSLASTAERADPPPPGIGSREFDLLCLCASVELTSERAAAIANVVEAGVDWEEFLRQADHHGLVPLVARNLGSIAGLPPPIAQSLCSKFETNTRRNLWFLGELLRVTAHCELQGIKLLPYKGPILAQSAYGDIALRSFGDLDFLIHPADFEPTKRALAELGYEPSEHFSPAVERFWLRYGYERAFDGPAGKNLVELQWQLTPHFFVVNLRTDELLQRARQIQLSNHPVWSFSPEDTFLVLCVHSAKHLWIRLLWLCDIVELVRSQPIDFELALARARQLGILRFVLISFWLANRLLNRPIPAAANDKIGADPQVALLGEQLAARLARGATYDFESTEYFRWVLKLRERRRDRLRFLSRLLWTPGVSDLATTNLPQSLFPLYRAIRIFRLIRKLL